MAKAGKSGVLPDHARKGKRLVPPMLSIMGDKHSPYSWTRQLVPEAIWIWLLLDHLGLNKGVKAAVAIGNAAAHTLGEDGKAFFCKLSSFQELNDAQRTAIRNELGADLLNDINSALGAFFELLPENPLQFLSHNQPVNGPARTKFAEELQALYDRYGRPAALTLATVKWMAIEQDKLRVSAHLWDNFVEDFRHIADYPKTERSKAAASSFRAGAPLMLMMGDEGFEHNEVWQKYFWDGVGTMGPCTPPIPCFPGEEVPQGDVLGRIIFSYRNAARDELHARLDAWGFDLHDIEVSEVVSGLLSRQTSLALEIALAPSIWNPHTAPLILRAMADVFLTLAWILTADSKSRAARFVEDGLGAVKLEIAHRKKATESGADTADSRGEEYIEMLQTWLDSQRIEHLVEVNLGSWSGMSTRAMAEEAGYIDYYNYVYQPFSSAVHSSWFHIGRFNLVPCDKPAHRGHRIGHLLDFSPDPHWLYLAAKYLQKTFTLFDEKTDVSPKTPSSFELLLEMLDSIELDDESPAKEE